MLAGYRLTHKMAIFLIILGLLCPALSAANDAPSLKPVPRQYLLEGQLLELNIESIDGDGDPIQLGVTARPNGASFVDNGDGTGQLIWQPDFIGPNSSVGSPFSVTFWAGDGLNYDLIQTEIVVINNNRKPIISGPDTVTVASGSILDLDLSGSDIDQDPLSWSTVTMPEGMELTRGESAHFTWATTFADSGMHYLTALLTDQFGATDTATVILHVLQTEVYALKIDTLSVYPGENVEINVELMNLEEVSGINLVINFDPSAMIFGSLTRTNTRTENFEYFTYQLNSRGIPGDIKIIGVADLENSVATPGLEVGDGPVVRMGFYITGDLTFAGYSIPVKFAFRDNLEQNDNTMTDPDGARIDQDQIDYYDGYVKIKASSQDGIGDINLNGLTYEIGDVIYFTNYFADPSRYPLSPEQILNSDVNGDGYAPNVADLVYLVNRLMNILPGSSKISPGEALVDIAFGPTSNGLGFSYRSVSELGAVALVLKANQPIDQPLEVKSAMLDLGMQIKMSIDGDLVRIIIYSDEAVRMPSGLNTFMEIENDLSLTIDEIQLSSADGFILTPVMKDDPGELLPAGFELYQNYPNPFNPATEISFSTPQSAPVSLKIYNILGQEIRSLVDEVLPAGNHLVTWNGRDDAGRMVSSGIYFYSLSTESYSARKKMILLK